MILTEQTAGNPEGAVFNARNVTKTYHMCIFDVHALRGVDRDSFQPRVHDAGRDLMFFGSTTHHVVRTAACPVLTLRE